MSTVRSHAVLARVLTAVVMARQPMKKEGGIVLGTGGDESNGSQGNFYEGFMATGSTSDATDDAVQANIVAVGYKMAAAAVAPT